MFKRKLLILESTTFWPLKIFPYWLLKKTRFYIAERCNSNEFLEFNYGSPLLEFTPAEKIKGRRFLMEKMGINQDKNWFVCLFARDITYLKTYSDVDASAHDFRNSDIDTYIKAVQYIIDKGGYVVRMGSVVNKPMSFKHEKFIDYSITCRDDFMDIYLPAHCKFFLGNHSGMTDISTIFHVPRVIVNLAVVGQPPLGKNDIFIPKKVRSIKSRQFINIKNLLQQTCDQSVPFLRDGHKFWEMGYEYVDNTEDDIQKAAKEMYERIEGSFVQSASDKERLQKYYDAIPENHWAKQVKTPIGRDFLEENSELYT